FYEAVLSANKKPLIIDAGANIGASVIWFATRYPGAHIVAVEPAPNNCDLLIYNTRSYDVEVRRAGLAKSVGVATLTDPGYGEWAYRTETSGEGISVPMTTL